jgi:hypothetical protein
VDASDALSIMIDVCRLTVGGKSIGGICSCKDKAKCYFYCIHL